MAQLPQVGQDWQKLRHPAAGSQVLFAAIRRTQCRTVCIGQRQSSLRSGLQMEQPQRCLIARTRMSRSSRSTGGAHQHICFLRHSTRVGGSSSSDQQGWYKPVSWVVTNTSRRWIECSNLRLRAENRKQAVSCSAIKFWCSIGGPILREGFFYLTSIRSCSMWSGTGTITVPLLLCGAVIFPAACYL